MSRTVTTQGPLADGEGGSPSYDWDELYPPDPELMTSAEGDTRGLADLQRIARKRIEGDEKA